jgi:RNA polymerase sigma factor (sigma-70 family)
MTDFNPSASDDARLEAAVAHGHEADRELARRLGRPPLHAAVSRPAYLERLDARPALAPGAEADLVARAQAGDEAARAALIDALMPPIAAVARKYRASGAVGRQELLQEGVVGVLRALERYDPGRGAPFWSYASWWVRQAMQQLVSELTAPAVLSDRALRQLARLKDAHRQAVQAGGREPTREELVSRSGLTGDQVDELLAVQQVPRSLDEPIPAADGTLGTFGELLADPLAEDAYERVLGAIEAQELRTLLAGLSERERDVLRARYGLDGDEQTLGEVGDRLGVSAERIRQLERRALAKLGAAAEGGPAEGSR